MEHLCSDSFYYTVQTHFSHAKWRLSKNNNYDVIIIFSIYNTKTYFWILETICFDDAMKSPWVSFSQSFELTRTRSATEVIRLISKNITF